MTKQSQVALRMWLLKGLSDGQQLQRGTEWVKFQLHCLYHFCDAQLQQSRMPPQFLELHFYPVALHLNSYQRGYFTSLTSSEIPLGQVKAVTIYGFHIHIGKVMGLQSFFMFYWPSGIVCTVCRTGITIQREVRESSHRSHYSKSNTCHIHMPSLTHY